MSVKFDIKNLGTPFNREKMRKYIGKKGWLADSEGQLYRSMRMEPSLLADIDCRLDTTFPFQTPAHPPRTGVFFYPAPEPEMRPYTAKELIDLVGTIVITEEGKNWTVKNIIVQGENDSPNVYINVTGHVDNTFTYTPEGFLDVFYHPDGHSCGVEE